MRCNVKFSYDSGSKCHVLDVRKARRTQSISITNDLLEHMKNPAKKTSIRAEIETQLKPLMTEYLGITENEMKVILDEFLVLPE